MSAISIEEWFSAALESFPYLIWETYGKFEVGFAALAFPLANLMNPAAVYSVMGATAFFLKAYWLLRSRPGPLFLAVILVFFIVIFETNQSRASFSLAFLLAALAYLQSGAIAKAFALGMFAVLFHLTAIPFVAIMAGVLLIERLKLSKYVLIVCISAMSLAVAKCLPLIAELVGGKLAEYVHQSSTFGIYQGVSGINLASIVSLAFASLFFWILPSYGSLENASQLGLRRLVLFAAVNGLTVGVLILNGGVLAIVGDRLWLFSLPIFVVSFGYSRHFMPRDILFRILIVSLKLMVVFFVVGNLLFRYPATNFFHPITPIVDLSPPELFDG